MSDNGKGIDTAQHDRIFEIFQSLGPRKDGRRGTGIGLAIVKKIVETHGGRVARLRQFTSILRENRGRLSG